MNQALTKAIDEAQLALATRRHLYDDQSWDIFVGNQMQDILDAAKQPPLRGLHDHPTENFVVTLHVRDGDQPIGEDNPAHTFGPFISEDEAREFEKLAYEDECSKVILDLFVPPMGTV